MTDKRRRDFPSFHVAINMYLDDRNMLLALAQHHRTTNSALVRKLIWDEAIRQNMAPKERDGHKTNT